MADLVKLDRLITEKALAQAWGLRPYQVKRLLRDAGAPHYLLQRGTALYDGDELYEWVLAHMRVVQDPELRKRAREARRAAKKADQESP
jgi:hypothetical protein